MLAFQKKPTPSNPRPFPAPALAAAAVPRLSPRRRRVQAQDANYLAHDARNWLTVLQVYCDLLRTSGAHAAGYEKWVEELSGAVERGRGLVASLIDSVDQAEAADGAGTDGPVHGPVHIPVQRRDARSGLADVRPAKQTTSRDSRLARRTSKLASPDSKSESGNFSTRTSGDAVPPLDLGAAICRRAALFQHLAGAGIQVELDAPIGSGLTALSESAFERILHNLVGNAIEAMPEGGRLTIALRRGDSRRRAQKIFHAGARGRGMGTHAPAKTLLLRVSDTGEGIGPDRLPHIFEAGVSGRKANGGRRPKQAGARPASVGAGAKAPARGLGLAIVRKLIESAGGSIRVRSKPGKGSCFEIEFLRLEVSRSELPLQELPFAALPPPALPLPEVCAGRLTDTSPEFALSAARPRRGPGAPPHNCTSTAEGTSVRC